jgi:multidrug resistance efflux pump
VGTKVKKGDPLVQMDTSLLDEEIEALRQTIVIEQLERERRFTSMVQGIRADIQDTMLVQSQDQAELEVLKVELERLEALLTQKLIDRETVIRQKARVAVLNKNLTEYPKVLTGYRKDLSKAEDLSKKAREVESSENGENSLDLTSERLDYLFKRKAQYTLRAANDGTVNQIFHQRGEIVAGGTAILKLIIEEQDAEGNSTKTVQGLLPEKFAHYAKAGSEATVYPIITPDAVVQMEVVSVTPHMVTVPDQASALPNGIIRGRVILLRPKAGESQDRIDQLLHGESVVIRVKPKSLLDLLKQI